jgi:hypothetical protein
MEKTTHPAHGCQPLSLRLSGCPLSQLAGLYVAAALAREIGLRAMLFCTVLMAAD